MKKTTFIEITRKAHRLARIYKEKYSNISYIVQYGIFFKLLYQLYKNKTQTEKMTSVSAKKLYSKSKELYLSITKDTAQAVNFYVRGQGLNVSFFTSVMKEGKETFQYKLRSIQELLNANIDIIPLMGLRE